MENKVIKFKSKPKNPMLKYAVSITQYCVPIIVEAESEAAAEQRALEDGAWEPEEISISIQELQ